MSPLLKIISLRHTPMNLSDEIFSGYLHLCLLDLAYTEISYLPTGIHSAFRDLSSLIVLNLSHNSLSLLQYNNFDGLSNLRVLDLKGNEIISFSERIFTPLKRITWIDLNSMHIKFLSASINYAENATYKEMRGMFAFAHNLSLLNLSNNNILSLEAKTFSNNISIHILDFSKNPLLYVDPDAFLGVHKIHILKVNSYKLCCLPQIIQCLFDGETHFSSCKDLMANLTLRTILWTLGTILILTNTVALIVRIRSLKKCTHKQKASQFLLINLGLSDSLYGIYMLIIASADSYYRGSYVQYEDKWHRSVVCKTAA
jgi:hypothetical protein